jgi:hypothetical protein
MRCESDFFENPQSEKERNLEAGFDCRLVSHPKSALSLDRVPGDSLRIVAGPLDSVGPDYARTLLASEVTHRQVRPEENQGKTAC